LVAKLPNGSPPYQQNLAPPRSLVITKVTYERNIPPVVLPMLYNRRYINMKKYIRENPILDISAPHI
jgi:hypothetical protein